MLGHVFFRDYIYVEIGMLHVMPAQKDRTKVSDSLFDLNWKERGRQHERGRGVHDNCLSVRTP